jgi:hypothetical protein
MRHDVIPFLDRLETHPVTIYWDIAITKMSGLDRWRVLILVDKIVREDGSAVTGIFKIFCQVGRVNTLDGGLIRTVTTSGFDARSFFASSDPMMCSQFEAVPIRLVRDDYSNEIDVTFRGFVSPEPGAGATKADLIPDPKSTVFGTIMRASLSEDVHYMQGMTIMPTKFPGCNNQ